MDKKVMNMYDLDPIWILKYIADAACVQYLPADGVHTSSLVLPYGYGNKYGISKYVLWFNGFNWIMRTDVDTVDVSKKYVDEIVDEVKNLSIRMKNKKCEERKRELNKDFEKDNQNEHQ